MLWAVCVAACLPGLPAPCASSSARQPGGQAGGAPWAALPSELHPHPCAYTQQIEHLGTRHYRHTVLERAHIIQVGLGALLLTLVLQTVQLL